MIPVDGTKDEGGIEEGVVEILDLLTGGNPVVAAVVVVGEGADEIVTADPFHPAAERSGIGQ